MIPRKRFDVAPETRAARLAVAAAKYVAEGATDEEALEKIGRYYRHDEVLAALAKARQTITPGVNKIVEEDRISRIVYDASVEKWLNRHSARAILLSLPRVRWLEREDVT